MISERLHLLSKSIDVDLFEDALGLDVMKKMGDEDICRCPLPSHNGYDANPSFSINRKKLLYNCFACGVGGNIIDLVARVRDCDYEEAYVFCKSYGGSFGAKESFNDRINNIFSISKQKEPEKILPIYKASILKDWVQNYSEYLVNRGIEEDAQDKFMLGFDPEHSRGDYTGPAIIIPHFFKENLVGYQERWIDNSRPKDIPKYTNTKNFPRRETLFGFDFAASDLNKNVIVVESALTVVYLHQFGYPAVGTFGAQVTDEQIKLLQSFSWGVVLAFDNDAAGKNATDVIISRLRKTIPVHVLDQFGSEKADLNDLSKQEVVKLIENAKPWFMKGL